MVAACRFLLEEGNSCALKIKSKKINNKILDLFKIKNRLDMAAHGCNPSSWEAK